MFGDNKKSDKKTQDKNNNEFYDKKINNKVDIVPFMTILYKLDTFKDVEPIITSLNPISIVLGVDIIINLYESKKDKKLVDMVITFYN